MITTGDELTLRGEALRVKQVIDQAVVFTRLNPPPPVRSWVPEPKVYVITTARVDELLAEGAMVPTAVTEETVNKVVIKSNQGFTDQEIEVDTDDKVFVVRNGQMYQIHFDCLDALGVSTDCDTYVVKAVDDENFALVCNYPDFSKKETAVSQEESCDSND